MKPSTVCLPDADLRQLLSGDLPQNEISAAEDHLADCDSCRSLMENMIADSHWWDDARSSLAAATDLSHDAINQAEDAERETTEQLLALLGPTDDPSMLGRIGTYEIVGLLGRGGMGVVFKGYDAALSRFVAIKMLLPHLAASGAARKRFAREAQAAAAVVDDHVMAIHGVSEWNSVPYFVMPYARGVSLQRRLDTDGPLEVREILRIGTQAAKGLAAAHSQGLVHRDVKPANIFLDEGVERVQLMDFGLARAVDDASLTRSGTLAGTPQFMSPEQARGESIDHRSDLFSLGSVLYTMCTGHAPFRAETSYGVLRRITDDTPRNIRELNADIPAWLEGLVFKLLAKSADDRLDSADEVATVLEECLAHVQQPTTAPLPKTVQRLSTHDGLPRLSNGEASNNPKPPGLLRRLIPAPTRILLSIAAAGLLLLTAMWATDPPDISGTWHSAELGEVKLTESKSGRYEGTFSRAETDLLSELSGDFAHSTTGKLDLKWSRIERRFNGTWREDNDHFGNLSIRLIEGELRGGWTSAKHANKDEQHPRLGDLAMTRSSPPVTSGDDDSAGVAASEKNEPATNSLASGTDQPAAALKKIKAEHEVVSKTYSDALDNVKDDVDLNRVYETLDPRDIMTPKYLAFEEKYRGTEEGLKALIKVSQMASSVADPNSVVGKGRVEVIDRILQHYMKHEGLDDVTDSLSGGPFGPRSDQFLNRVVQTSPYRSTQAKALVAQIVHGKKLLKLQAQLPAVRERTKLIVANASPEVANGYLKELKRLESTDFEQLRVELNEKLRKLEYTYSDVELDFYGTGQIAAHRLSHAINKVVIGTEAPELVADDIEGNTFRLSDQRGKITVIVFGLAGDADDREMYAPLRQTAAKYRSAPVRFVGIMSNSNRSKIAEAKANGAYNWPVIPQPLNGPIALDWGIEGYPSTYIVDARGILHPEVHMPYFGEGGYDTKELDEKVEELLTKQAPIADVSKAVPSESNGMKTPEALMKHFADCQFRNDLRGSLNCYSDKLVSEFAISSIKAAHQELKPREMEPNEQTIKKIDEMNQLLKRSVKSDSAANASAGLLKDPRQFLIDFEAIGGESEDSKEPPKRRTYTIKRVGEKVLACEEGEELALELKQYGDRWLIDGYAESNEPAPPQQTPSLSTSDFLQGSWRVTGIEKGDASEQVPKNTVMTFRDTVLTWTIEPEPPQKSIIQFSTEDTLTTTLVDSVDDDTPTVRNWKIARRGQNGMALHTLEDSKEKGWLVLRRLRANEARSTYASDKVTVDISNDYGWSASEIVETHMDMIRSEHFMTDVKWPSTSKAQFDEWGDLKRDLVLKPVGDNKIEIGIHGSEATQRNRKAILAAIVNAYSVRAQLLNQTPIQQTIKERLAAHSETLRKIEEAVAKRRALLKSDATETQLTLSKDELAELNDQLTRRSQRLIQLGTPAASGSLKQSLEQATQDETPEPNAPGDEVNSADENRI